MLMDVKLRQPVSALYCGCNNCGVRNTFDGYSCGGCWRCGYNPKAEDAIIGVPAGRAELLGIDTNAA